MSEPLSVQAEGTQITAGNGQRIAVPSGQEITLLDVIWNVPGPEGLALRFRFVAPQIARDGGTVDYETASADMLHLCQSFALAEMERFGPTPQQIIISLSDRPVPFGQTAPEATQFFEAFTLQDGSCMWEMF